MPRSNLYEYSEVPKIRGNTGLINPHFMCYQISVLQSLFAADDFSDFLVNHCLNYGGTQYREITEALARLCKRMRECSEASIEFSDFYMTFARFWPAYTIGIQQDAEEFMIVLLDCLHESLKENQASGLTGQSDANQSPTRDLLAQVVSEWDERKTKSTICNLFHCQVVCQVSCHNVYCGYSAVSTRIENHLTVSVGTSRSSLLEILKNDMSDDRLPEDAKCCQCGVAGHLRAEYSLGRLPPVLIFHLSRFVQTGTSFFKNENVVDFPPKIDMKEFTTGNNLQSNTTYELFAAVSHSGSMSGGHYIAFCHKFNRWFEFDDAVVTGTSARKVLGCGAYLLFYKCVRTVSNNLPFDEPLTFSTPWQAAVPTQTPANTTPEVCPKTRARRSGTTERTESITEVSRTSGNAPTQSAHSCHDPKPIDPSLNSDDALQIERVERTDVHHVIDIVLTEDDVPGAALVLEKLNDYFVPQLQRWLKCRGLVQSGSRETLRNRILNHVRMGKGAKIDPKVDNGKWYDKKKAMMLSNLEKANRHIPTLPAGKNVWKAFPSVDIPSAFNRNQVEVYVRNLPAWTFSYERGVEMVTPARKSPAADDASEETGFYTDEENVHPSDDEGETGPDYFTRLVTNGVSKCIDRGRKFYRSGRILNVWDAEKGNFYFAKAQVQASMEAQVYLVTVTVHQDTGKILDTTCTCKAQALKRCGHVAGVLILMVDHVEAHGYDAVTCTGKPCYWVKKSVGKNPGIVKEKEHYYARMQVKRRAGHDPRASRFHNRKSPDENADLLKQRLTTTSRTLLWVLHLKHCHRDEEVDIASTERIATECSKVLWKLNQCRLDHDRPFEVPEALFETVGGSARYEKFTVQRYAGESSRQHGPA